jgi:Flp pilus assembly protein TadD
MAQIGRNDPCPCGSGKKYKRCCSAKDQVAASASLQAAREAIHARARAELDAMADEGDLDGVSIAIMDLVQAGKLDDAEAAAHSLVSRFPDAHHGHNCLGMVCEARGHRKQAAVHYRKVIDIARQHPDALGPDFADNFRNLVDRLDPPTAS